MTSVMIAVDETADSVRAARVAHALFGDRASYRQHRRCPHGPGVDASVGAAVGRDVPGAALAGAETLGELSDPAEAIARSAELCGVDVIVIGAHERSWVDRLLHRPPLPRGIVERATAPVLVVH